MTLFEFFKVKRGVTLKMKIFLEPGVDRFLTNLQIYLMDKPKTYKGYGDFDPIFKTAGGFFLKIKIILLPVDR